MQNFVRNVDRHCKELKATLLMNKIVKASSKDYKNNKGKILDNSIVIMKMT